MGHSQAINEAVYQSPLALNELVHVGGFLQTVDQGLEMAAPRSQQYDPPGGQQSDPPGDQQRAADVFPEKRVAVPKIRRDATATELVKEYFHKYLTEGLNSKGSLPEKSLVIEFLREYPILEKFTELERIDLVKT
ncbi:hypothetical protein ElyMa_006971200 [Elysia marginata]|uniref:Uncharacterized protein n=1 Tax=Elysia marginata TaxID=1093978 RepID=A0AAV4JNE2_9GAST|nr:hypothetical protein ElyMa_006971200 [Elysia marginata]